jgi:uncharacterized protein YutE (UPF0331/DUF86 family)
MTPPDEFPSDRANRIADGVEDIERNVSRLRELQALSRAEYTAEDEQDLRDAVERKFEKLTEAMLDVAREILKQERGSAPGARKQTIAALEAEDVVDAELGRAIRESVGFRDVLAHSYGPVVNDDLVYDALQHSLGRYVEFLEAIHEYLQRVDEGSRSS